jgi:hypothetical protein
MGGDRSAPYTLQIAFPAPDANSAYQIGTLILKNLQEELSGERHGRWYPVPGNIAYDKNTPSKNRAKNYYVKYTGSRSRSEIVGSAYQASAPGEAPASRTGRLRQSFFLTVDPDPRSDQWFANLRTNVQYADDLEYGTEKIDPRPFMEPAVKKSMGEIQKIYVDFTYDIMRKGV